MLVLSRKKDERIEIGNGITLVVTEIENKRVSIGIIAPKDMKILRTELIPKRKAG